VSRSTGDIGSDTVKRDDGRETTWIVTRWCSDGKRPRGPAGKRVGGASQRRRQRKGEDGRRSRLEKAGLASVDGRSRAEDRSSTSLFFFSSPGLPNEAGCPGGWRRMAERGVVGSVSGCQSRTHDARATESTGRVGTKVLGGDEYYGIKPSARSLWLGGDGSRRRRREKNSDNCAARGTHTWR
jgi:hypothetical protein